MKNKRFKILVTGGTGMLGAHLIYFLLKEGKNVCAIKRDRSSLDQFEDIFNSYGDSIKNYSNHFEWIEGDVLHYNSLEKAVEGVDYVYHCAAVVSFSKKPRRIHDINIRGTQNIVYACLKAEVKKLCFVSSIAALGNAEKGTLINEDAVWDEQIKHSVYAESKYFSEQVVWQTIPKGLDAVVVNPGVILGVADENNNSMRIFSMMKKGLLFYTNGGSGYICVKDVCKAMVALTESAISGERFVLVAENLSNKELLSMIAKRFNKRPPFVKATKLVMYPFALFVEVFAKIFGLTSNFDRGTVKVVLSRSFYTSDRLKKSLGFEFSSIQSCVNHVCDYMLKKSGKK